MYKDGVLTISEFGKGMGDNPLTNYQRLQNLEVFEQQGVAKIAYRTMSNFTVDALPIARARDVYGNEYVLTGGQGVSGKLYKNGSVLQSGLNKAWDLCIFNDYLFVSYNTVVSVYGPLNASPTWFANWKTGFNDNYYMKLLPSKTNAKVYVANGAFMAEISSFTGGTPSVAPTATLSLQSALLPVGEYAVTMAEIGSYLMIGTQGGSTWYDRTNHRVANIYPWDKETGGYVNNPVQLNENSIHQIISDNNKLYIVAGSFGNLYETNTSSYRTIRRIPWSTERAFNASASFYPNAISLNHTGNLLIGSSSSTGTGQVHGVFEVNLKTGNYESVLKHTISTIELGDTLPLTIGLVSQTTQDTLLVGWQSGSSYGYDITDYRRYASGAIMETPLYQVGSVYNKKTFQNMVIDLVRPLVSNQSISIQYRRNLTDSYVDLGQGTWSYATNGAVSAIGDKASLSDIEKVQFKITLTQPISVYPDNINLASISLW